jgi:mannose PTS system EIIA component
MTGGRVGVVVAGHGPLGRAIVESAELIAGEQTHLSHVGLEPLGTLESLRDEIADAVRRADDGHGVLVLIDLFGGTPGTAAALALRDRRAALVAGVNLPMLLEVLMAREHDTTLEELSAVAVAAGTAGIVDLAERLGAAGDAGAATPDERLSEEA